MLSDININGTKQKIGGIIADGQWIKKATTVFSSVSFTTAEVKTYTVSNYLPENDKVYEVLASCYANTGSKSGDASQWWLRDINDNYTSLMGYGRTRTNSNTWSGGCCIIPLVQINGVLTLKVNITAVGNAGTGNNGLYLNGYRKAA